MNVHGKETNILKTVPVFERQKNRCNHILNKNKGRFCLDLVSKNCGNGKKLWQALNKILSRSNATVLPSFGD